MGNSGSSGNHNRRRNSDHNHHQNSHPNPNPDPQFQTQIQHQPQPSQPAIPGNRYVFTAATPYPPPYPSPDPNPNPHQNISAFYQYNGFYPPPPPPPLPAPFDHHHRNGSGGHLGGRYPCGGPLQPPPYVEHQKAVTIRNDVNLKKETLRVEPDEMNPGKFLVAFTFDATIAGSITVYFFAKEGLNCNLMATKDNVLQPVTVSFKEGLGQKFMQPLGSGIDFSMFDKAELTKEGEIEVYPLAVRAEASPADYPRPVGEDQNISSLNSQITQAVFEKKENGEYRVRVMKQILWVNGTRYELQEIYGIGNSVDNDFDGNDPGKECVICLSEPRDTTVLPCRHMCMCSGCAKVLRFQTNRCPICRQPVERLLEIKVNRPEERQDIDHQ